MQVVTFTLNELDYAIDIGMIREIIYFKKTVPLPEAPSFVEGVLDLRGAIVPVIDLKKTIKMKRATNIPSTHILIVKLGQSVIGIIVDEVKEVIRFDKDLIQSPQKIHQGPGALYLKGVVKVDEQLIFLLDLDAVLTSDEQAKLSEIKS
jgi:purine-binding chemotaxis protein CheW